MIHLALFASGGGTTAMAVCQATKEGGRLYGKVKPVLLVASKPGIGAIGRVIGTGVLSSEDIVVISPNSYKNPDGSRNEDAFGVALIEACQKRGVTFFGQYGWLAKTPKNFLNIFQRGINQHPAPLCFKQYDFGGHGMYGRRCHLAVLLFRRWTNRDFWTKATAHWVTENYDEGAVIRERKIEILPTDDVDALQARVLPVEHEVQIEALLDFADGNLPYVKPEPLVLPHELVLWSLAREAGKTAYPRG